MIYFEKLFENPLIKKIVIGTGILIGIFVFLLMIISCSKTSKRYTYEEVESILVRKVKEKYGNGNGLPSINNKIEVSVNDLINDGSMKSITDLTGNMNACSAKVTIYNNNDNYLYVPNINCAGNYKSKLLYDTLINDSLTTSGNGLYLVGNEYVFKGDNVKNYIKINNRVYRIIRINGDGTIRLLENKVSGQSVWDDRYNIEKSYNSGVNNFYYNSLNSRIKDYLENVYNDNKVYSQDDKVYFIPFESCIGKRSINDSDNSRNTECTIVSSPSPLGLLELYEYLNASLDSNCKNISDESCTNYNYFNNNNYNFWTVTADKDSTYKVFKISSGKIELSNASGYSSVRAVVTVNKDLIISSGDGTENNPYVIQKY